MAGLTAYTPCSDPPLNMLFNSYVFILAFLPVAVALYHALWRYAGSRAAISSLVLMSLLFYGWWSPKYLPLLLGLMVVDFVLAQAIRRAGGRGAKLLLALGLTINLCALGYYKYANFFVANANSLLGLDLVLATVVLPIGISFFTFQKIAFLVDVYQGKVSEVRWLDYALFVTFFPQLIAGPIVHHSEMMPQFSSARPYRPDYFATGLTIFVIGLSKKVLLADTAARYASPAFAAVAGGAVLDTPAAWTAALAYTAQLYFDFSAYSDMAVGIGLLFGIRLPINFDSPYKAGNIVDFWRRWHITLSRFLRDYLYIPLGGNRKGKARRYFNLMATMVLGGFWHGAGWTFVIWGALHGAYLIINHAWQHAMSRLGLAVPARWLRAVYAGITFLAVVVGWVFFRAADTATAVSILLSMAGQHGDRLASQPIDTTAGLAWACALLLVARLAPNTYQWLGYMGPSGAYGHGRMVTAVNRLRWRTTGAWATVTGVLLALNLANLAKISEFIYFQF